MALKGGAQHTANKRLCTTLSRYKKKGGANKAAKKKKHRYWKKWIQTISPVDEGNIKGKITN